MGPASTPLRISRSDPAIVSHKTHWASGSAGSEKSEITFAGDRVKIVPNERIARLRRSLEGEQVAKLPNTTEGTFDAVFWIEDPDFLVVGAGAAARRPLSP